MSATARQAMASLDRRAIHLAASLPDAEVPPCGIGQIVGVSATTNVLTIQQPVASGIGDFCVAELGILQNGAPMPVKRAGDEAVVRVMLFGGEHIAIGDSLSPLDGSWWARRADAGPMIVRKELRAFVVDSGPWVGDYSICKVFITGRRCDWVKAQKSDESVQGAWQTIKLGRGYTVSESSFGYPVVSAS